MLMNGKVKAAGNSGTDPTANIGGKADTNNQGDYGRKQWS
jgi:hypothetical protein